MKWMGIFICCLVFNSLKSQSDIQKKIQTQFIEIENGGKIHLPAGRFDLDAALWLDGKENVEITGAGIDKTILSFSKQLAGAEGIKITNSRMILISGLTVQDTKGDGLKAQDVDHIRFDQIKVEWTRGAHEKNGGYGIYPVQCKNVLIENCLVRGASDAGIYVGQSHTVIVRHNKAYENVAGIEIENTLYADVYENEMYENTGGLLIFDLPDLQIKKGGFCRAFKNHIHDNNHKNFAPKGNIVGKVPLGTGVMIMAANRVALFDNQITNNITCGTAIVSYYISENPIRDSLYYPYPQYISVSGNQYSRPRVRATMRGRIGLLFRFKLRFGRDVPHIIWDGIQDEKQPGVPVLCIDQMKESSFANIQAHRDFKGINRDPTPHLCTLPPLEAIRF
jgi:parallel beta-helix repeat protein